MRKHLSIIILVTEKYITVGYISYYNNIKFSLHFIYAFYVILQMLLSKAAYNWGTHLNSEAICHAAISIFNVFLATFV